MKVVKNIPLIQSIQQIGSGVVQSYFEYDLGMDAKNLSKTDTHEHPLFFYLLRRCGTWMVPAQDAFFHKDARIIWTHQFEMGLSDECEAFIVEPLLVAENGEVYGSLYPIDYVSSVQEIKRCSSDATEASILHRLREHMRGARQIQLSSLCIHKKVKVRSA